MVFSLKSDSREGICRNIVTQLPVVDPTPTLRAVGAGNGTLSSKPYRTFRLRVRFIWLSGYAECSLCSGDQPGRVRILRPKISDASFSLHIFDHRNYLKELFDLYPKFLGTK